jgi:hypothetical protein
LLMRGNVRRGEVDASQLEVFLRSSRQSQVSVVDGIEGSAKQSDIHRYPTAKRCVVFLPGVSLDSQNPEFWVPK